MTEQLLLKLLLQKIALQKDQQQQQQQTQFGSKKASGGSQISGDPRAAKGCGATSSAGAGGQGHKQCKGSDRKQNKAVASTSVTVTHSNAKIDDTRDVARETHPKLAQNAVANFISLEEANFVMSNTSSAPADSSEGERPVIDTSSASYWYQNLSSDPNNLVINRTVTAQHQQLENQTNLHYQQNQQFHHQQQLQQASQFEYETSFSNKHVSLHKQQAN